MTEAEHEADKVLNHRAMRGQELLARFSDPERNYSEFRRLLKGEEDTYKPFYRALALVLCPDGVAPGADREEVGVILRAAHPYFVGALVREQDTFDHLYDMFIDLYPPDEAP